MAPRNEETAPGTAHSTDPASPLDLSHGEIVLSRPFTSDVQRIKIAELVQQFAPHFEGNESESNWKARQNSVILLRRLTSSKISHKYTASYITVIKGLHDAVVKAINSLRTTLSTHGMRLITEAVEKYGAELDSVVEIFIHPLIKQCGNTKNQAASEANTAIIAIFTNTTYSPRLLQFISNATEEKNKGVRGFSMDWLVAILTKYIESKHMLEEKSGAENIQKIVEKGLNDADAAVRGKSLSAYWSFNSVWPARAEAMMETLPASKQKTLLAHQGNPKPSSLNTKASSTSLSKGPRAATAMGTHSDKPSIRDHIKAQKKKTAEKSIEPIAAQFKDQTVENVESATEHRPKSAGSLTGTAAPAKPVRHPARPVPARPKTAAAVTTPSVGTLSSAPKRPMFIKKTNTTTTPIPTSNVAESATPITTTAEPKRGRPLTVIANPPEAPIPDELPARSNLTQRKAARSGAARLGCGTDV